MTVPWKAWKTKYGFFHASHRPLKIPQNRRDFHIPTAQACTAWKSGKPTTGFPLSHPVHAMTTTVLSLNRKTKRKEVGRYAASSFFMPLSLRSSGTDFMLILQLENAGGGVVFELDTEGNYTVLYRFTGGAGGGGPFAGVIRDSAGNLYGTASTGGTTDCTVGGCGVVYKLSPSGEETVLHTFTGGADGDTPYSGLVADAVGNLYGTTTWGGKGGFSGAMFSGGGVVYKIEPH